jgi:methylenetetrahydrofolate reductase (NADPH)
MRLPQAYGPGKFGLSFELFPPKTPDAQRQLFEHLDQLVTFKPSYITCTYGAGGSTRDKTLEIVEAVHVRYGCAVATHLTCVGATVDQLRAYLADARQRRVQNVVALRGDPPRGESVFRAVDGGLRYANELVELIRGEFADFGVAVAGYPETHQEAPSPDDDLANLKRKVDAGADVVITQLFYDNADFFRFRDACERCGIRVPIVPGILPITNFAQVQRITALCGARLPKRLVAELSDCPDEATQFEIGVRHAIAQVQSLVDGGVPGIHFYVLNRSQAAMRVLGEVRCAAPAAAEPLGADENQRISHEGPVR